MRTFQYWKPFFKRMIIWKDMITRVKDFYIHGPDTYLTSWHWGGKFMMNEYIIFDVKFSILPQIVIISIFTLYVTLSVRNFPIWQPFINVLITCKSKWNTTNIWKVTLVRFRSMFWHAKFHVSTCARPWIESILSWEHRIKIRIPTLQSWKPFSSSLAIRKSYWNATIIWKVTLVRFRSMFWHAKFDVNTCAWSCFEWILSLSQWVMIMVPNVHLWMSFPSAFMIRKLN